MVKLDILVDEFLESRRDNGCKESTIKTYREKIEHFIKVMDINEPEGFNKLAVTEFVRHYRYEDKSPHTINNYLRHVKAFCIWMIDEEIIDYFKIKFIKAGHKVKPVLNKVHMEKLLEKPNNKDYHEWRSWLVVNILHYTGIRRAELKYSTWGDVDFTNSTLILRETKNGDGRMIPINAELKKAFYVFARKFKVEDSKYLVTSVAGKPIVDRTISQAIDNYFELRNVPASGCHIFRRTFVTDKLNAGHEAIKISKITGHKTLTMINKHYYKASIEGLRDIVE